MFESKLIKNFLPSFDNMADFNIGGNGGVKRLRIERIIESEKYRSPDNVLTEIFIHSIGTKERTLNEAWRIMEDLENENLDGVKVIADDGIRFALHDE